MKALIKYLITAALLTGSVQAQTVQVIEDNRENMHNAKALHNIAIASVHGIQ
ncbi:hypothetical protein [Rahnella sp. AA]|uniref:hypothetical protein n=1 Tax=Rahnella sp. AA TaxID=2057180 RepID=UPI0012FF0F50|nr:hypothetical protein [Rahnella sp. AA]